MYGGVIVVIWGVGGVMRLKRKLVKLGSARGKGMSWWCGGDRGARFCKSDGGRRRRIWKRNRRARQRRDGGCGGWLAW